MSKIGVSPRNTKIPSKNKRIQQRFSELFCVILGIFAFLGGKTVGLILSFSGGGEEMYPKLSFLEPLQGLSFNSVSKETCQYLTLRTIIKGQ
jgi:hypothetical protein